MQKPSSIISAVIKRISLQNNFKLNSTAASLIIASSRVKHYSSSSSALKTSPNSNKNAKDVTKSLLRVLESEISTQARLNEKSPEEEFNPQVVLAEFDDYIKGNNWTLNHPEKSNSVTLKRRDENLQAEVTVKFDVAMVANEMYETDEQYEEEQVEEAEEDVEASQENENEDHDNEIEDEDFSSWSAIPFSVEIKRDSIPGRTLVFDCVAEGSEYDSNISVENASILPESSLEAASLDAYTSPNYSQLDEDLKEAFDAYVNKLVVDPSDLAALIKSYSYAAEGIRYEEWLKDVKTIISPKKN